MPAIELNLDYWARQLHDGDHPLIEEIRRLRADKDILVGEIRKWIRTADACGQAGAAKMMREAIADGGKADG